MGQRRPMEHMAQLLERAPADPEKVLSKTLAELRQVLVGERDHHELLHRDLEDEGPGFPEEMLLAGVRPFATGRAEGTGLGLAMVRRFARDHDGELELANREPHGARATLRLPCSARWSGASSPRPWRATATT
jgi:nitrogen fixation/metabolism regulation signal transduction histidine kinase